MKIKNDGYNYQFSISQLKNVISIIENINDKEISEIANIVKKNLEENTRTLVAVSHSGLTVFQLDVGMSLSGQLDNTFQKSNKIYLVTVNKDNIFKAKVAKISYGLAKKKAKELNLPAKKSIVQNLIRSHLGKVAVNKFNIRQYKLLFLNKGNEVMSNFIDKAIMDREFF